MTHKPIISIALFLKPAVPEIVLLGREIMEWLRKRKVQVFVSPMALDQLNAEADGVITGSDENIENVDLALVLGGDGTILWVARKVAPFNIPVLSFNMGNLGFLAAYTVDDLYPNLERVLDGDYATEDRMMLTAEHYSRNRLVRTCSALNDVIINKQLSPRLIKLEMCVNDMMINRYLCDGLIVSTPTGSTAYSLSAGGPIMVPDINALVVTPICPHTLTNRPIVLKSDDVISIRQISEDRKSFLTLDGQTGGSMRQDDTVVIQKAPYKARIIANQKAPFFQVLRHKLAWGHR
jgi:NAD+ kinase